MKYLSVCSGIEAATVAWHPLGWTPAAFSEIEKFPSQVLAHHYPSVPNLGDMTKFMEWSLEPIDLFVGGTPCQSFSVAGLRKGLADPRGNLMLTYLAIAERFKPRWLVWENVPGVLSSNAGKDFGSFLGGLGELGYGFAYRVLDAQYFGVPQRRRRVFVVACLGDWRSAAAVLFERHSVSGHPAPSRETGQEVAKCLTRGACQRLDFETEDFVTYGIDEECNVTADGFGPLLRGGQGGTRQAVATLTSNGDAHSGFRDEHGLVPTGSQVRRLTPIECERLQGFPDNYTKLPGIETVGPRYKALGNSMAVPVMRWIGQRIQAVSELAPMKEAA